VSGATPGGSARFDRLLKPRSIAVIGGGAWCAAVIRENRALGFDSPATGGQIWPVHPSRRELEGVAVFSCLDELPGPPDAAFVGVNRHITVETVAALAARGAGGAVCFASGFREAVAETGDGSDLQDALLEAAGAMPILGPNCYGFVNALDGAALWPDHHGLEPVQSGVAIVTQSSNIALNLSMQQRGLPIAYLMTVGNQAQTDLAQITTALLDDPRVTAVGLHIEGLGPLRGVEAMAAKARACGKPIIALKVGASEEARRATVSHTASLAGSAAGAAALFTRLGIAQVTSLSVLLETLKLVHVTGPLRSARIASLSCSGGEASLMADSVAGTGLTYPALTARQEAGLRDALGPKVALANPLDYHTYIWGDRGALRRCFAAMLDAGAPDEPAGADLALGLVVLDFPNTPGADVSAWHTVIDAITDVRAMSQETDGGPEASPIVTSTSEPAPTPTLTPRLTPAAVPMAIVATLPECLPPDVARAAMERGIPALSGVPDALHAVAAAARLSRAPNDVPPLLLPALKDGPVEVHTEATAKALLSAHGLAVPRSQRGLSAADAVRAADAIGYPVVLKGEGVAHKTEAGAVAIGLQSPAAVEAAAAGMPADSFLVEEMVSGAVAELLVGVASDPAHGYVLTIGAGGVLTELLTDTASLLLPVTQADVAQAVDALKIARVLHGYRGRPAADMPAIISAVMALQDYVTANAGTVLEVEINPLICTPSGAVAADALLRACSTNMASYAGL